LLRRSKLCLLKDQSLADLLLPVAFVGRLWHLPRFPTHGACVAGRIRVKRRRPQMKFFRQGTKK